MFADHEKVWIVCISEFCCNIANGSLDEETGEEFSELPSPVHDPEPDDNTHRGIMIHILPLWDYWN